MKNQAELLRQELARITDEASRTTPSQPSVFPQELIERVVQYVRQQARHGQSLQQCSQELGVPRARLHYWVYKRPQAAAPSSPRSLLRPVQVSAELVHVQDGVPERRYTLRSPAGWELSDLRFPELVELLRSLP